MLQKITVETTNALLQKGVKDLSDMLYRQTTIKPECYLPILQYLWNYAKPLTQDKQDDKLKQELSQKTIIDCDNYEIHSNIEKVKKILYNQTTIRPEVYLILFAKLDEYDNILKKQEMQIEHTETKNTQQKEETKKSNKLAGLKGLFK